MFLPLNERQFEFWRMRRDGMAGAEIARSFSVSRQSVSKALQGMDSKISRVLMEMARSNQIEIRKVSFERGVLFGRSVQLNTDAIIFVSAKHGVQVWYWHDGDCSGCSRSHECRELLRDYASEIGIALAGSEMPAEMADELFHKLEGML
ncbi:MAG TPA: hypothetical protein EYP67_03730 [Methanosarcinales archaeon]|nr:hypothetical protein [Methanosarcinales archaeon]